MKLKNVLMISFLAIAGIFGATSFSKNISTHEAIAESASTDDDSNLLVRVLAPRNSGFSADSCQFGMEIWNGGGTFHAVASDWLTKNASNNWNVIKLNGSTDYWYSEVTLNKRNWLNNNGVTMGRYKANDTGTRYNYANVSGGSGVFYNMCTYNTSSQKKTPTANSVYVANATTNAFGQSNKGFVYKIRLMYKKTGSGSFEQYSCVVYDSAHSYTLPTPTAPTGYRFDCWSTTNACTDNAGSSITPSSDTILYAKYSVVPTYTVKTYTKYDGSATQETSTTVSEGDSFVLPAIPDSEQYGFDKPTKWSISDSAEGTISPGTSVPVSGNLNYYAIYTAINTKTLYFNIEGFVEANWGITEGQTMYVYRWDKNGNNHDTSISTTNPTASYIGNGIYSFTICEGDGFIIHIGSVSDASHTRQSIDILDRASGSGALNGSDYIIFDKILTYDNKQLFDAYFTTYSTPYPNLGYYIVGLGDDWSLTNKMDAGTGTDLAKKTSVNIAANDEMKIRKWVNGIDTGMDGSADSRFIDVFYGYDSLGSSYSFVEDSSGNIKFKEAGYYDFYLGGDGKIYIVNGNEKLKYGYIYLPYNPETTGASTVKLRAKDSSGNELLGNSGTNLSLIGDEVYSSRITYDSISGLTKILVYNLRGTSGSDAATFSVSINNGSTWSSFVSTPAKGSTIEGAPYVYWKVGYANVSYEMGSGARAVFEIDAAIEAATNHSVCELSQSEAQRLKKLYEAASDPGASCLAAATINTYASSASSPDKADIRLPDIKNQIDIIAGGGRAPSAIHSFNPFTIMNGESGDNTTTIIIIIAASVSLLSITALSILLVKKRKRVDN